MKKGVDEYQAELNDLVRFFGGAHDYKEDFQRASRLAAILTQLVRHGYIVKITTAGKTHVLDYSTENIRVSDSGQLIKYNQTQRFSTLQILRLAIVDAGSSVAPFILGYAFEEPQNNHCRRLRVMFQRPVRTARGLLLKRLNARLRGWEPSSPDLKTGEVSWEMAGMSIDELMDYLAVELDGATLIPRRDGKRSDRKIGMEQMLHQIADEFGPEEDVYER